MFKCIQKIKAEPYNYDPDIGWNTRKKIIEYYKNFYYWKKCKILQR